MTLIIMSPTKWRNWVANNRDKVGELEITTRRFYWLHTGELCYVVVPNAIDQIRGLNFDKVMLTEPISQEMLEEINVRLHYGGRAV